MTQIPQLPLVPSVALPRDEAFHEHVPWEIWWITADLRTENGRRHSAHVLVRHTGGGQVSSTVTITDVDSETERSVRIDAAPGEVELLTDRLDLRTGIGRFQGSYDNGYLLKGGLDAANQFDLRLTPTRPVLFHAGAGQYTLGSATTTQYSVTGLETAGNLRLDGRDHAVTGRAWYDRQWLHSGQLSDIGGAFTWFGITLDNGDTISLWDTSMRVQDGRTWATVARKSGTHIITAAEPVAPTARGEVTTPAGHLVPRHWRAVIPELDIELEVTQRLVQDNPQVFFYTGVLDTHGRCADAPVVGNGYCDLVAWPS